MVEEQQVQNRRRFTLTVPYANKLLTERRKKMKIAVGIALIISFLIFLSIGVFSLIYSNKPSLWASIIFIVLAGVCAVCAIYSFCTLKPSKRDIHRTIRFCFYEYSLTIEQDRALKNSKPQVLTKCLYRNYKNRQYVAKVLEYPQYIEINIYTGTRNFVPVYGRHIIPKSIFKEQTTLDAFTAFLKSRVENDYIIK